MAELINKALDGPMYAAMISLGAEKLRVHAQEINDLNVFPIPDGDTGDNMLMTVMGGVNTSYKAFEHIGDTARVISDGMLFSARGNSGVILSQFFEGIAKGLYGIEAANADQLGAAFSQGVRMAYSAVMTPSEGTILTVMREATEYACGQEKESTEDFLGAFIDEAKRSLERTPELLPVLKKAGVVDSGAAGLICIAEGMMAALSGERAEVTVADSSRENSKEPDPELFGEDDELQFGYCTELLVRLQSSKTDISNFDTRLFTEYLHTVGDSIVAVQNGSIVKLHIHTFAPDKVLAFCRHYGEFLKVKIENMMLQHNSGILTEVECKTAPARERKKYGIVAVANGEGLKQLFKDHGVDKVVEGGQSMNPSAEEFIAAFDEVNADNIIVFPNNSNVILAAKQAARLYSGSEVTVIESRNIGDGYCALCMMDTTSDDMNEIVRGLNDAMSGTVTVEISRCVREAMSERGPLHVGDYISFWGKKLLVSNTDRFAVLCQTLDALDISCCEICILICGKDSSSEEAEKFEKYVHANYRGKEVYIIDGGQDVYDYILVLE